jgi:hypothetical protein
MIRARSQSGLLILLTVLALHCPTSAPADGLKWPDSHLLPAFSTPAPVLDCIELDHDKGAQEILFASLEGIVNRTQPRLACVTRHEGEGEFTWLKIHKLKYHMIDGYAAILKYRTNFTGLVVTDPFQPHTINLAATMAGVNNELVCEPSLLPTLTQPPYNLPIVDDLRGRFADKYAVYGCLYSNYWPRCTHRIIAGMSPGPRGQLREYLIAVKSAAVWLNPGERKDAQMLQRFVSEMKPLHGVYMGWWPSEDKGLKWIAQYGIPVLASDFFRNGSVFSGVACHVRIPAIPTPPPLENKVYVAFILSDGDNIQYMQHTMKVNWEKPGRGNLPVGWTVSPLTLDMDPMMLDYYWNTATTNDCLVSGPSGAGYNHISDWSAANIAAFTRISAPYLQDSGLRVITVWDKVNQPIARAFATNCPSLLGLTDQSGAYSKADLGLRTIRLTPAYTSSAKNMIASITKAAKKWNGTAPLFIAAQSDIWKLGPADLRKVAGALDPQEYQLVRPDQLFILAAQQQ